MASQSTQKTRINTNEHEFRKRLALITRIHAPIQFVLLCLSSASIRVIRGKTWLSHICVHYRRSVVIRKNPTNIQNVRDASCSCATVRAPQPPAEPITPDNRTHIPVHKKCNPSSAFFNPRVLTALLVYGAVCSVLTGTLLAFLRPETPSNVWNRTLTFAERVSYQRAIEDVYWCHRAWPKERPDPKPSFDAVMSQAQLEKKVEDYLWLVAARALPPARLVLAMRD